MPGTTILVQKLCILELLGWGGRKVWVDPTKKKIWKSVFMGLPTPEPINQNQIFGGGPFLATLVCLPLGHQGLAFSQQGFFFAQGHQGFPFLKSRRFLLWAPRYFLSITNIFSLVTKVLPSFIKLIN